MNHSVGLEWDDVLSWHEVRDMLLGQNSVPQNVKRAIELAASLKHPEAQWLSRVMKGKRVETAEVARTVLLQSEGNEALALCFAAMINHEYDPDLLQRSDELGCSYAKALQIQSHFEEEERLKHAILCCSHNERDAFFWVGLHYKHLQRLEQNGNFEQAKENFVRGAELGHARCMFECRNYFAKTDPTRWYWWGQAARRGQGERCFYDLPPDPKLLIESFGCAAVFSIGRTLEGCLDIANETIFDKPHFFKTRGQSACFAFNFFQFHRRAAVHRAVSAWVLCAIRLLMIKDIRLLIGRLVWQSQWQTKIWLRAVEFNDELVKVDL